MDSVSGLLRAVFLIFAWLLRVNAVTTPSDSLEIFVGERSQFDKLPGLELGNGASSLIQSSLVRRQNYCNDPGYVQCPNGLFCCKPTWICQPLNPRGGTRGFCCPPYALQCNGLACCNSAVATCCETTCCPFGYRCSNGQCISPAPTIPTTTSSSSSLTSTTVSIPLCPIAGRDIRDRQLPGAASCPSQTATATATQSVETRIPVATMTFDYQYLRTKQTKKQMSANKQKLRENAVDQLFQSMSKGLLHTGNYNNEAIFTFENDEAVKAKNRADAGCTGSPCNTGSTGNSCDEFPFASTQDGGTNAIFNCIVVLAQNIQGGVISSFSQKSSIQAGQHYRFQIIGYDCLTNSPTTSSSGMSLADRNATILGTEGGPFGKHERRDLTPGGMEVDNEPFPPLTADSINNVMIVPIGDTPAGMYSISTHINNGSVSSLRVLDYLGVEVARADVNLNTNSQHSLPFTLSRDGVGLGLFMDTQLDTVNITTNMLTQIRGTSGAIRLRLSGTGLMSLAFAIVALLNKTR